MDARGLHLTLIKLMPLQLAIQLRCSFITSSVFGQYKSLALRKNQLSPRCYPFHFLLSTRDHYFPRFVEALTHIIQNIHSIIIGFDVGCENILFAEDIKPKHVASGRRDVGGCSRSSAVNFKRVCLVSNNLKTAWRRISENGGRKPRNFKLLFAERVKICNYTKTKREGAPEEKE